MSSINQIAHAVTTVTESTTIKTKNTNKSPKANPENESNQNQLPLNEGLLAYKPDLEKIKNMKAETDQRMIELFTTTVSGGYIKQLGGLRGALERILKGEKVEGLDIEITDESIKKAQEDIGPDGYWSPEKTSDRFLEFAKALSGNDPSKAKLLTDAVKKGFEQAEELWGGELPEISKQTYELTLKKFEDWANSTSETE